MTRLVRKSVYVVAISVTGVALLLGCGTVDSSTSVTDPDGVFLASTPDLPEAYTPTLFPAGQDGKWGFIDGAGQVVIDFQYDEALDFSDGMAQVRVGENWGYIDESGAVVIQPQWYRVGPFSDGLAPVYTRNTAVVSEVADLVAYIDKTGKVVIPSLPGSPSGCEFSEGLAGVYFRDGGCAFIDSAGQVAIRLPEATAVRSFSGGLAAVRDQVKRWGYIDRSGRFVIEPRFRDAQKFSNGLAVAEYAYGEYAIIDMTGRVVKELEYDDVRGLRGGRAAVLVGGGRAAWKEGKDILTAEAWWGYMDETGELVIPTGFQYAWDFAGGLAWVMDENGKMGYIDLDGNYVCGNSRGSACGYP